MDFIELHKRFIENSFTHLTWFEDICEKLNFKGISQVWVEEPAWYFWIKNSKGA